MYAISQRPFLADVTPGRFKLAMMVSCAVHVVLLWLVFVNARTISFHAPRAETRVFDVVLQPVSAISASSKKPSVSISAPVRRARAAVPVSVMSSPLAALSSNIADVRNVSPSVVPLRNVSAPVASVPAQVTTAVPENPTRSEEPAIVAVNQGAGEEGVRAVAQESRAPVVSSRPDSGPVVLSAPDPVYPPEAREAGRKGNVRVKLLISEQGHVEKRLLVEGSGVDSLDQAALDALQYWSFHPAYKGGLAISAWIIVPVSFTLH